MQNRYIYEIITVIALPLAFKETICSYFCLSKVFSDVFLHDICIGYWFFAHLKAMISNLEHYLAFMFNT